MLLRPARNDTLVLKVGNLGCFELLRAAIMFFQSAGQEGLVDRFLKSFARLSLRVRIWGALVVCMQVRFYRAALVEERFWARAHI